MGGCEDGRSDCICVCVFDCDFVALACWSHIARVFGSTGQAEAESAEGSAGIGWGGTGAGGSCDIVGL